jgi:hypothetical protein
MTHLRHFPPDPCPLGPNAAPEAAQRAENRGGPVSMDHPDSLPPGTKL